MRHLNPSEHPLITTVAVAVAAAAMAVLAWVLVVVPLANGVGQAPAQFAQWYAGYSDGVGQQLQQAQQPGAGAP